MSIMVIKYLPFKGPSKFTQIWDFWFENKPSGNPEQGSETNARPFLLQFYQLIRSRFFEVKAAFTSERI
jgi:hypothetical protein